MVRELELVESDALTGKHVILSAGNDSRITLSEDQRANSIRISEPDDSETYHNCYCKPLWSYR